MNFTIISNKFTNETLKEIARNSGFKSANVTAQFTGTDIKKGDSYLSEIFRLNIIGDKEEKKVLVKTMPKTAARRSTFRCVEFFRNEINFYSKIIPSFMEFQKSTGANDLFVEFPQCLASYCDGENDFIVLEDINVYGYTAPNRQNYTDTDTCTLILKTLGRFHAVSLAFKDQKPKEFFKLVNCVEETYYREDLKNWYGDFLKVAINVALDAVEKCYPNSDYTLKTSKFLSNNLFDEMISMINTKSKFAVIGHGDCWRPNFLTKYDKSSIKPEKAKIIDFQLARYGSPIFDIMFFIYNSTSQEQRIKDFESLLEMYHSSASDLIRKLGSEPEKIFSIIDFKEELKNFGRFACGFCIESLPLSMIEDDDITDLDSIKFENSTLCDFWKIKPIENIENRKRLADIFRHAVDNSYI